MEALGYSLTYPTRCRDCGDPIFFHTNGDGDVVLFDPPLGPPWPRHGCYEERVRSKPADVYDRVRATLVEILGRLKASDYKRSSVLEPRVVPPRVTQNKTRYATPDREELEIIRCDPNKFTKKRLFATGWIHDVHQNWSISRFAAAGTIGHISYHNAIGSTAISQVTIVDSDLVSYTFIVPMDRVSIRRGDIVSVELERVQIPGREPFYVSRALGKVTLH